MIYIIDINNFICLLSEIFNIIQVNKLELFLGFDLLVLGALIYISSGKIAKEI
jgi:hypothetical protein